MLQGIYKRVIGEDQPENGEFDQRLWISTKGDFLSSFKADRASLEDSLLGLFGLIWSTSFQRAAHLEDGAELPMKFEPFPPHLLGKPVEEIDQFVYEKVSNTTCNCELVPYYCRHKTGKLFQSFPNMEVSTGLAVCVDCYDRVERVVINSFLANNHLIQDSLVSAWKFSYFAAWKIAFSWKMAGTSLEIGIGINCSPQENAFAVGMI